MNTLHYLANEGDQSAGRGMDKSKCGCLIFITYGLLCASTISNTIKKTTVTPYFYYLIILSSLVPFWYILFE